MFSATYTLHTIKVFTAREASGHIKFEVSTDGTDYREVHYSKREPNCDEVAMYNSESDDLSEIACSFQDGLKARYLRVVIDDDNAGKYPLREVVAWGT